tara:strand:+ start:478 stop:744 length:267 start_codon:yes stop_codon:yes gene_type:complete
MTIKFDRAESLKKVDADSKNTGGSVSQISILTDRINYITGHLKTNRKDHSARRGLVNLVSTRKKLLKYLKRKNVEQYESTIKELGIRK